MRSIKATLGAYTDEIKLGLGGGTGASKRDRAVARNLAGELIYDFADGLARGESH